MIPARRIAPPTRVFFGAHCTITVNIAPDGTADCYPRIPVAWVRFVLGLDHSGEGPDLLFGEIGRLVGAECIHLHDRTRLVFHIAPVAEA